MKKIISIVLCITIFFSVTTIAFATLDNYSYPKNEYLGLTLDGYNLNNEWYSYANTYTKILTTDDSANNINSAGMMYALDEDSDELWLMFIYSCKNSPDDMSNTGIFIELNNWGFSNDHLKKYLESTLCTTWYHLDYYDCSVVMAQQRDNSVICECKIDCYKSVKSYDLEISFVDNFGARSITKTVSIENPTYEPSPEDLVKEATIIVPNDVEIYYKQSITMNADSDNVPEEYHLAWFENGVIVSDGNTLSTESLTKSHTYTVKIIESLGNIVSTDAQNKSVTITVKDGFFDKIISFFIRLFGSSNVEIN